MPTPLLTPPLKPEPRINLELKPLGQFLEADRFIEAVLQKENPSEREKQLLKDVNRKLQNCCGQYAMATVFQMHGLDVSLRECIDKTNPMGIFTDPIEMKKFLNQKGLPTHDRNGGTLDALEAHVKTGRPAILLVNADADTGGIGPHWMVVGDVRTGVDGERVWKVSDAANMARTSTYVGEISEAKLKAAWTSPLGEIPLWRSKGISVGGFDNYWIAVDVPSPTLRLPGATTLASNGAHIVSELAKATARTIDASRDAKAWLARVTAPEQEYRSAMLPEAKSRR